MNKRYYQCKLEDMAGLLEKMDKHNPRETHLAIIKLMREVAKHLDTITRDKEEG